ncbi:Autophagy-related protein 3 [Phytophthora cactorum]|nr:Autophagy-related protein 3 [Phytophthora cactorum]
MFRFEVIRARFEEERMRGVVYTTLCCYMGLEEMRDGSISNERFCVEADLLQKGRMSWRASRPSGVANVWRRGSGDTLLTCDTTLKHLDGNSYLVSTGNVRQYRSDAGADSVTTTKELGGDIVLDEEDNWMGENEAQTTVLQSGDVETALLEFHIVYHTILPDAVTRDVQFPGSNGRSTFVAMEEHPVLGKPFSFLHPCETAAAMQLLQAQLQSSSTAEASPDSEVPQYLTSWLSLVQPLTGISPLDYYSQEGRGTSPQEVRIRVGGVPPPATASTRAKFAFGSRLPDTGTSVLKSNGKAKLHTSIRTRHEHDVRSTVNPRKRRRPISQDEDEVTSDAKTSHRPVTVKTALPRQGSRLPAPTKVPDLVSGSHLHTKSPSNLQSDTRSRNRQNSESWLPTWVSVQELQPATEPEFWITRRKMVEAALEELDAIENRVKAII